MDDGANTSGEALAGDDASSSSKELEEKRGAFAGADFRRGAEVGFEAGRGGLNAVVLRFTTDLEDSGIFRKHFGVQPFIRKTGIISLKTPKSIVERWFDTSAFAARRPTRTHPSVLTFEGSNSATDPILSIKKRITMSTEIAFGDRIF